MDVMTLSRADATALLGPLHRLIASRESEAEYGGYSAATTAFAEALAMGSDQNDPTWSNSVQAAALATAPSAAFAALPADAAPTWAASAPCLAAAAQMRRCCSIGNSQAGHA